MRYLGILWLALLLWAPAQAEDWTLQNSERHGFSVTTPFRLKQQKLATGQIVYLYSSGRRHYWVRVFPPQSSLDEAWTQAQGFNPSFAGARTHKARSGLFDAIEGEGQNTKGVPYRVRVVRTPNWCYAISAADMDMASIARFIDSFRVK